MKRRPDIFPKTGSKHALSLALCLGFVAVSPPDGFGQAKPKANSIEEKTKIHRLATTNRSVYDAFVYLNRIPEKGEARKVNYQGKNAKLLAKIDKTDLPKGYTNDKFKAYKDTVYKKLTGNQKYRIHRLWQEKRKSDPNMPNPGHSFVRIMEHVAENKIQRQPKRRRQQLDRTPAAPQLDDPELLEKYDADGDGKLSPIEKGNARADGALPKRK
jgi:hypothetical protein